MSPFDEHVDQLINLFGYWGSDPSNPWTEWKDEVVNTETRRGYWEWVAYRREELGFLPTSLTE